MYKLYKQKHIIYMNKYIHIAVFQALKPSTFHLPATTPYINVDSLRMNLDVEWWWSSPQAQGQLFPQVTRLWYPLPPGTTHPPQIKAKMMKYRERPRFFASNPSHVLYLTGGPGAPQKRSVALVLWGAGLGTSAVSQQICQQKWFLGGGAGAGGEF